MIDAPRARFVDGLRVTALHLNHLQDSALGAAGDLREIVGLGRIGIGLRLLVDGTTLTVSRGLAIAPDGSRIRLDEDAPVVVPAGDGPFTVRLAASSHDLEAARLGDEATIVFADTLVELTDPSTVPAVNPSALVIGTVRRESDALVAEQPAELFVAPGDHGHSGQFFQDASGRWRWDGVAIGGSGSVGSTGLDLTVLKGLSWEPRQAIPFDRAGEVLRELAFVFDRNLDPSRAEGREGQIVTAWFLAEAPLSSALVIRGRVKIGDNQVVWSAIDDDIRLVIQRVRQQPATVLLDLNCDFVIDEAGRPVSACSSTLVDVHLPRPGGILRAWLLIAPS